MARWVYEDGTPVPDELVNEIQPMASHGPAQPAVPPGERDWMEGAATLGSGIVGSLAGAGAGVASLPYYVARHALNPTTPPPERSARELRQRVQEGMTYMPQTPAGARAILSMADTIEHNPVLSPEWLQRLEQGVGQATYPELGEITGLAAHPLNLLATGPARAALGAGARLTGELAGRPLSALARGGERAAVRALGAPASTVRPIARVLGREGLEQVGREVQQIPGAALRQGPEGVFNPRGPNPLRSAMDPVGAELAQTAEAASQTPATVDLGRVLERFRAATSQFEKDPIIGPRLATIRDYVTSSAAGRGIWTPDSRQLLHVSPAQALAMRQGLDDVLFSATTGLKKGGNASREFGRLRRIVDDELGSAMTEALGPEGGARWAQLNAQYGRLATARRLAEAGYGSNVGREFAAPQLTRRRYLGIVPGISTEGAAAPPFRMMAAHARLGQPFSALGF